VITMTAKILPTALLAVLALAMLGSYGGTPAKKPTGQETCYRSQVGKGWICLWESAAGEKCWRSEQGTVCTRPSFTVIQNQRRVAIRD